MAEEQITARIAEALEVPHDRISGKTKASDVAEWDSMGTLSLVLMLHRDFGVHVEPDQTDALQSVEGIVALLRAKRAA